jgi:hypothetical protein
MTMSVINVARTRMAMLGRHIQTMALKENILFPTAKVYLDVHETLVSGYTIQVDVRHEEKTINFVTEAMCPNEKKNVYLRQKRMMRELYPEYLITERHT